MKLKNLEKEKEKEKNENINIRIIYANDNKEILIRELQENLMVKEIELKKNFEENEEIKLQLNLVDFYDPSRKKLYLAYRKTPQIVPGIVYFYYGIFFSTSS